MENYKINLIINIEKNVKKYINLSYLKYYHFTNFVIDFNYYYIFFYSYIKTMLLDLLFLIFYY